MRTPQQNDDPIFFRSAGLGRLSSLVIATMCFFVWSLPAAAQILESPMRIAEGSPGQILVSDHQQDVVFALDKKTLQVVWSFSLNGTPVAVAQKGNLVFIGNATTRNVEVYRVKTTGGGRNTTLEFVFNLGLTPTGAPGTIQMPSDMALDRNLQFVFVLDSAEKKVKVFDFHGNFVQSLPPAGGTPLLSPTALAVDELRQEVLVSDYGDPNGSFRANVPARILIYNYSGTLLKQIDGAAADPNAQFDRPQGLATDDLGRIFLAEALVGQVFVFDRESGAVVKKLGSFGEGPGQLELPLDLVLDKKSGDLFVTNNMLKRIEVFRAAGGLQ